MAEDQETWTTRTTIDKLPLMKFLAYRKKLPENLKIKENRSSAGAQKCQLFTTAIAALPRAYSQGRLNQWAHWARAQGLWIFSFWRPPTGCGEINFYAVCKLTIYALLVFVRSRSNINNKINKIK